MDRKKKAVIIEPSSIVRKGLLSILNNIGIHTTESGDKDTADILLSKEKPDYIIVNPFFINNNFVNQFRSKKNDYEFKTIALLTSLTDSDFVKGYDTCISIYDSSEIIKNKINTLSKECEDTNTAHELTCREKQIVVSIVNGKTNKQIAEEFSLSAHTVMAHRRNIISKLQIHSSSGLTIYAIVNKLVKIEEIKHLLEVPKSR